MSFVFLRRVRELYTGQRRRPWIFSTDTVRIMFCKLVHFKSVITKNNIVRQKLVLFHDVNLISTMLHYLTPMLLGFWQGSLRMQIFFVELHNKRWNMWSSFSRRRLWVKPGVFIRDITATVSWQYKELVTPIVRMFRKYFLDIIVMKNKMKRPKQAKPPKRFCLIRSSFWCLRSFRFVVLGFSSEQTRSEQMNKVHQIRLFRRYSGYILLRYFKLLCSMFTIRLVF